MNFIVTSLGLLSIECPHAALPCGRRKPRHGAGRIVTEAPACHKSATRGYLRSLFSMSPAVVKVSLRSASPLVRLVPSAMPASLPLRAAWQATIRALGCGLRVSAYS